MDDKAGVRPRIPGRFSARPGSGNAARATPSRSHSRMSLAVRRALSIGFAREITGNSPSAD